MAYIKFFVPKEHQEKIIAILSAARTTGVAAGIDRVWSDNDGVQGVDNLVAVNIMFGRNVDPVKGLCGVCSALTTPMKHDGGAAEAMYISVVNYIQIIRPTVKHPAKGEVMGTVWFTEIISLVTEYQKARGRIQVEENASNLAQEMRKVFEDAGAHLMLADISTARNGTRRL